MGSPILPAAQRSIVGGSPETPGDDVFSARATASQPQAYDETPPASFIDELLESETCRPPFQSDDHRKCCFNPFPPASTREPAKDKTDLDQEWARVADELRTSVNTKGKDAAALLSELVQVGYLRQKIPEQNKAIEEAAERVRAERRTLSSTQDLAIPVYGSQLGNTNKLLFKALNALEEKEQWHQALVEKRAAALENLTNDIFTILAEAMGVSAEITASQEMFTSGTLEVIAATFAGLGEKNLSEKLYTAASASAPHMAARLKFRLLALSQLEDKEIAKHASEIKEIFETQTPALLAMSRTIEDAKKNASADDLDITFSEESWKSAGYSFPTGLPDPAIPPGDVDALSHVRVNAWKLLYRMSRDKSRKARWKMEDRFDELFQRRMAETGGSIPSEESLLYAGCVGEMLLQATMRSGDLEMFVLQNNSARERMIKLEARVESAVKAMAPYREQRAGNPFFEMEASLSMRLLFDGPMALHRYPEALEEALPTILKRYADAHIVRARFSALSELYPHHFKDNCLLTGIDFSKSEQGLDAASREQAMFAATGGIEDTLWDWGAGIGGGAGGCAAVGGLALLVTKNPLWAMRLCRIGGALAGAVGAGEMERRNAQGRIDDHQREIERAKEAGISLVSQEEAKKYTGQRDLAIGLNYAFGAAFGLTGASLVRIGLNKATELTVRGAASLAAESSVAPAIDGGKTAAVPGLMQKMLGLPTGTKLMAAGGSLLTLDYFGIDNISFEQNLQGPFPSANIEWGTDYHIDTPVGILGALLLTSGMSLRLIESPAFRSKFFHAMVGEEPNSLVNPKLYEGSFWKRLGVDYGLLSQKGEELALAHKLAPFTFLFNAAVGNMERVSLPVFLGDFTLQQFLMDEEWFEKNGIKKTPQLSFMGGIAFSLWAGNRIPIRMFKIPADSQRVYFAFDRGLDIYTMSSSGNAEFWDADWARISLKYISGWSIGQIRGNMLRYSLAKRFDQRYLSGVALEGAGLKSRTLDFHSLPGEQKALFKKLLTFTDSLECTITLDPSGNIVKGGKVLASLSAAERHRIATLLTGSGSAATFSALFRSGKDMTLTVAPKLTKKGLLAFSFLHNAVIGTPYDYIRGEYIIFGDGNGYAMWTLSRALSILLITDSLKASFGWKGNKAVAFDIPNRFFLSPYWTNWTRIYAKANLWWPYLGNALDGTTDDFLTFLTGSSNFTANGLDNWNVYHAPLGWATNRSGTMPAVDTFPAAYEQFTQKLLEGKLSPEKMEVLDELIADMIGEVRDDIAKGVKGGATQTKIEHAELLASMAYVVHHATPSAFRTTFEKHRNWIDDLLGPEKPITPKDVKQLATMFGETTWIGALGKPLQQLPFFGQFYSGVDGRSKGYVPDGAGYTKK